MEALLLGAGLAAAVAVRVAIAGGPGALAAASPAAALVFAAALTALAASARTRLRPELRWVPWGLAGAAVLVAAWWAGRGVVLHASPPTAALIAWSPLVVCVAVAEEAVLRGALFKRLLEWRGRGAAVAVTTLLFAAMHVPLYGWGAVPVDLAVGLWLGALRLAAGSWQAPAIAHALADLAGGWLA